MPTKLLRRLAQEDAQLPEWLFDESYQSRRRPGRDHRAAAADRRRDGGGHARIGCAQHLLPLRAAAEEEKYAHAAREWRRTAATERLVYFKLITGGFRVGVSRLQVTQALAQVAGVDAKRVAQRLMGYTQIGRSPRRPTTPR